MKKKTPTRSRSKKAPTPDRRIAPRLFGIAAVAARLRLTPRRVQQLVGEGLPRVTRGKYDIDAVLDWYILRLEAQLAGDTGEDGGPAAEKREGLRLLSTKADLAEIKLGRQRRELIAIVDVEKAMTDLIVSTKAQILAIPARIASDLASRDPLAVRERLDTELKEALSKLASAAPGVSDASDASHGGG